MRHWHVIRSKAQKEYFVYEQLGIRKIEAFCPMIRVKVVNPRAHKFRPYFPGYLFVYVDLDQIGSSVLKWMPGVAGMVCYGGEPAFVPESLLKTIRKHVDQINNTRDEAVNDLEAGEIVSVTSGPLAGYRAIFDSHLPGHKRVRVLLQILHNQQVCVTLPRGQLERINPC